MSKYIVQVKHFFNEWKDFKEPTDSLVVALQLAKKAIEEEYHPPKNVRVVELVSVFEQKYDVLKLKDVE